MLTALAVLFQLVAFGTQVYLLFKRGEDYAEAAHNPEPTQGLRVVGFEVVPATDRESGSSTEAVVC